MVDLLVLGATGYTGKLVARYLAVHRERDSFTFGLAGRSKSKLDQVASDIGLPGIKTFIVDVLDDASLKTLFDEAQPKVLLTTVGPYWTYGFPVARTCAKRGVHYVDITGEMHFVRKLIQEVDFVATKTHAILVPCCGLDALPSDALAFLSARTMRSALESTLGPQHIGNTGVKESHTLFKLRGGVSGGTLASAISLFENLSLKEIMKSYVPDSLSPVKLRKPHAWKLVYKLPATRPARYGFVYPLAPGNVCVVQRTGGLLQVLNNDSVLANKEAGDDPLPAYGDDFTYSESMESLGYLSACLLGFGIAFGGLSLMVFTPLRWLLKRLAVAPGQGPSDEVLEKGFVKAHNVSVSTPVPGSDKSIVVESTLRGRGDPGYALTAVMVAEMALGLLKTPREELPALAQVGGVLTPMTALGSGILKRLSASGRFEFESSVRENTDR